MVLIQIQTQRSERCICSFWLHRHQRLIIPLIFLVLSSSIHLHLMAEARAEPSYNEGDQKTGSETWAELIGSRPPRCQFRCSGCGPCEAVQVPVSPQLHGRRSRTRRSKFYRTHEIVYSKGDDVTNYKPMGWKCKCGNLFFNP